MRPRASQTKTSRLPHKTPENFPSLPALLVSNRQRKVQVDLTQLRRTWAAAMPLCMAAPGSDAPVLLDSLQEVAISLVSPDTMSKVHRDFLNIDGPTDVITFPYGEILICPAVAEENSREFSTYIQDEIALYGIHGLLHLHGYDDISKKSAQRMRSMQANILKATRI